MKSEKAGQDWLTEHTYTQAGSKNAILDGQRNQRYLLSFLFKLSKSYELYQDNFKMFLSDVLAF